MTRNKVIFPISFNITPIGVATSLVSFGPTPVRLDFMSSAIVLSLFSSLVTTSAADFPTV